MSFVLKNANQIRAIDPVQVMDAKDDTGFGTAVNVTQLSKVVLELLGDNSVTATVKVFVSYQDTEPTWTDPVTASNRYEALATEDLEAQDGVDEGDTGITVGADGLTHHSLKLNGGVRWVNVQISAISAGDVSAFITGFNE